MKDQGSNASEPRLLSDVIADLLSSFNEAVLKADEVFVQELGQALARYSELKETVRNETELTAAIAALVANMKEDLQRVRIEEATVDFRFAIVDQNSNPSDPWILICKDALDSLPSSRLSSIQLKVSGSPLRSTGTSQIR